MHDEKIEQKPYKYNDIRFNTRNDFLDEYLFIIQICDNNVLIKKLVFK